VEDSTLKIFEHEPVKKSSDIIIGLPDTGLVGVISSNHIIHSKKMKEVATVESQLFPPMIVIHEGNITSPARVYAKDNLVALISEITVPVAGIYPISEKLSAWIKSKEPNLVLILGGIPVPNRMEIDKPKSYAIVSDDRTRQIAKSAGISLLEEGVMVGPYALLMRECQRLGVPIMAILAQSYPNYPDPGAAASVIETLNKVVGLEINVNELLSRAEEIKIKLRDLMRRTSLEMQKAQKGREYELPPLYV